MPSGSLPDRNGGWSPGISKHWSIGGAVPTVTVVEQVAEPVGLVQVIVYVVVDVGDTVLLPVGLTLPKLLVALVAVPPDQDIVEFPPEDIDDGDAEIDAPILWHVVGCGLQLSVQPCLEYTHSTVMVAPFAPGPTRRGLLTFLVHTSPLVVVIEAGAETLAAAVKPPRLTESPSPHAQ